MTYEEIVEKVNEEGKFLVQHFDSRPIVHEALRRVLELHKPTPVLQTNGSWEEGCMGCVVFHWPCSTIDAILEGIKK